MPQLSEQPKLGEGLLFRLILVAGIFGWSSAGQARDLVVSANDGKYVRVMGIDTYPKPAAPDTLMLIDVTESIPRVTATYQVEHSIVGPPQAVAITPDATLAFVAAPNRYDYARKAVVLDTFLQVVNLAKTGPGAMNRIDLGSHPQGLAINRQGTLLLAGMLSGDLAVVSIRGRTARLLRRLNLSSGRLAGVTFTHDGRSALVCRRDEQGIAVVHVDGDTVAYDGEVVSSGVAPYSIDVSSVGDLAVASNAGLAGLRGSYQSAADADSCVLIDLSRKPFRVIQYLTVPALPEGVAISPDGRWVAVQSMDGSNLPVSNPARRPVGKITLFAIKEGHATQVSSLVGGEAAQGIVFTADSQRILIQFNVEKEIAIYDVVGNALHDSGIRIATPGGPASLRSMPR